MKISMALGKREGLSRQTAHGCVATNLALPGFGSLMAGRPVGYIQAALSTVSFVLTVGFGVKFIIWYLGNWSTLQGPEADPFDTLLRMGHEIKWALLGIGLFGVAWLWGLSTNSAILRDVPREEQRPKPPKLS